MREPLLGICRSRRPPSRGLFRDSLKGLGSLRRLRQRPGSRRCSRPPLTLLWTGRHRRQQNPIKRLNRLGMTSQYHRQPCQRNDRPSSRLHRSSRHRPRHGRRPMGLRHWRRMPGKSSALNRFRPGSATVCKVMSSRPEPRRISLTDHLLGRYRRAASAAALCGDW